MKKKILIPICVILGSLVILIIIGLSTGFIRITKPVEETPIEPTPTPTIIPTVKPSGNWYEQDGFLYPAETVTPEPEPTEPPERQDSFSNNYVDVEHRDPEEEDDIDWSSIYVTDSITLNGIKAILLPTAHMYDFKLIGENHRRGYTVQDTAEVEVRFADNDELSSKMKLLNSLYLTRYAELCKVNPLGKDSMYTIGEGLVKWQEEYPEELEDPTIKDNCQVLTDFVMDTTYGDVNILTFRISDRFFLYSWLPLSNNEVLQMNITASSEAYLIAYAEEFYNSCVVLVEMGEDEK